MGLAHTELKIQGVQFHPESILTRSGHELLRNFLRSISMKYQAMIHRVSAAPRILSAGRAEAGFGFEPGRRKAVWIIKNE